MTSPSEEFVIRHRHIALDAAQQLDAEGIVFTHLRVSAASDNAATVSLVFANLDNPGITLTKGIRLENFAIRSGKVWFTNTAQVGKWIELEYWAGPAVGPPRIVNEGLIIDVSQSKATLLLASPDKSLAALAVTAIFGAAPTRREAIITNLASNTQTFRIGGPNVGATRGMPLPPGATLILTTTAQINGYNPGAVAESVALLETRD